MRSSSGARAAPAIGTVRTAVLCEDITEQDFGSVLSDVARLLWPTKTAAHVAALIGCTERAAEFWLAGDRPWSGDAVALLVSEILSRHRVRNVRVKAR